MNGSSWEAPDPYYVLGDFNDYRICRDLMAKDYLDKQKWSKKCWINITNSGVFSSDRTIQDYADEIWHVKPVKI